VEQEETMNEPTAASAARPAADWGRAADGIQLAGLSVFLLLNTTGQLPWSFWLDAFSLWPVLVMSAGLKIAFEKSRMPWLLMLGPVLVLGSLTWLASDPRFEALPAGPWQAQSIARPDGTERVSLEAKLGGARLRLQASDDVPADRVVDGRSIASGGEHFTTEGRDGVAHVTLRGGEKPGALFVRRPKERWDLRLPTGRPVEVRVSGAGIAGDFDLRRADFAGARAEGVFLAVEARLPAPRTDTEVKVSGVFNWLSLTVPEGTPVRMHGAGLPLNARGRGLRGVEGRPGYDVSLQGVFSVVEVRGEPAAAPPPARPPAEAPPPGA